MARPGATVAFDIEVVGNDWNELDDATRGYLLERARDDEERKKVPGRLALIPGCGRVIAIGLWNLDEQRGAVLCEGEGGQWLPWPERSDGAFLFRGSERELLAAFWQRVKGYGRLVSFNGRGYDGPVLMIRSAMLGVAPSRYLAGKPWEVANHCDLMDVLTFQGALRERYSLEYWCRRFGVESPKSTLDGSQVDRAYKDGQIERIADYCLRDCRATGELYRKLEPTILPLIG
jgi:hypothetical protein